VRQMSIVTTKNLCTRVSGAIAVTSMVEELTFLVPSQFLTTMSTEDSRTSIDTCF